MALLTNQIVDTRILSSMNGRVDLPQFLRVSGQGVASQVTSLPDDSRKNRKYPCPLCGKRFRFNSILSLHMRTHTGEKPFKCPYCDHRAAQKGNLKIHLRTHKQGILGKGRGRVREENRLLHELEERAILRDRQMRGTHAGPLGEHAAPPSAPLESASRVTPPPHATSVHDVQRPPAGFRCSFCKGKFRKQEELERHIRILHKPYKCTLCDFAAAHDEELVAHVETAHITAELGAGPKSGGGDKGKPAGEFPCEVCGQTFSQAWFLKGHMRKHKDSFEHCCQICGRRFKEPWFLKNHMKVHLNKLAAKGKLPGGRDASVSMSSLAHGSPAALYSQYVSSLHNRFLTVDSQMLTTASIEMKVREMLGRMIASGAGPATQGAGHSLLGMSHAHPPLSTNCMDYLQKAISDRDRYPGWQIMTPGVAAGQQMFPTKEPQHLAERYLSVDEGKEGLGVSDTKAVSRASTPGSLSHRGPTEITTETSSSHSVSGQDNYPQSSSPPTGEKAYRCARPSDYVGTPLDSHPYHFTQWPSSRDVQTPSPDANPQLRGRSKENWSPAAMGLGVGLESHVGQDLAPAHPENHRGPHAPRKSQHEPLDLSLRPDASPGSAGVRGCPVAVDELEVVLAYGPDLLSARAEEARASGGVDRAQNAVYGVVQLHKDPTGNNGEGALERPASGQERVEEAGDGRKWTPLKNNHTASEERGRPDFQGPCEALLLPQCEPGQWGRDVAEPPIPSLEELAPGQGHELLQHSSLLSVLRSTRDLSNMSPNAYNISSNGGAAMENDVASGRKPFQCRYCSYSASQKGNLKTHVLCVHRKPFDNSLYPDRRLRRSHAPHGLLPQGIMGDADVPGRDPIPVMSLCGT